MPSRDLDLRSGFGMRIGKDSGFVGRNLKGCQDERIFFFFPFLRRLQGFFFYSGFEPTLAPQVIRNFLVFLFFNKFEEFFLEQTSLLE